jgi:hypothetical protein
VVLRRRALLGSVAVLVTWLGATGVVAAHGGGATFEVLEAVEAAPGEVSLRVGIAHEADGHPAEGAIVEVEAIAPDGTGAPSTTLEREDGAGTYAARLDLPERGAWTLVVTSSFPPGTVEVPVTVVDGGGPAGADGAVVPAADPAAVDPDGDAQTVPDVADEDEGGSTTTNLVVAAVSGVVGGSLGLWASKRRSARRRATAVEEDDGGHPPT